MRRWAWVLFGVLVVALAATGYWGYQQYDARNQLRVTVANQYQRSFYDLIDSVENVQVSLAKGVASTSPLGNVQNLARVWQRAAQAQANLTQLPIARDKVLRTSKFLSQVSDYAYSLMRKNTSGQAMTEEDLKRLRELTQEAGYLTSELHNVQKKVDEGNINWAEVHANLRRQMDGKGEKAGVSGFQDIDRQMQDYPTLVYDGPFSDHVEEAEPKGLTEEEITAEEAVRKALEFVPDSLKTNREEAKKMGEIKGRVPGYAVTVPAEGKKQKRTVDLDVSKKGGHIISMVNYRDVDKAALSLEEAAQKGIEFLESRGFENMVPTYATNEDNVAVVPYVWKHEDTLIYPDQVKLKIAMDDGEILGFEALTYYMSHRSRDLPEPKLSKEEAVERVSTKLEVTDTKLALIPTEWLDEILCWEIKGTLDGEPYIVYINALNGNEERILKIIETENGVRTQ